jgi:hypothetical protein
MMSFRVMTYVILAVVGVVEVSIGIVTHPNLGSALELLFGLVAILSFAFAIVFHPALKSASMAERTTPDGRCYACSWSPGIVALKDHNPNVCPYLLALRNGTQSPKQI